MEAVPSTFAMAEIDAEVTGREKTLYDIYKKMRSKHIVSVLDVYGFRVVVGSFAECYVSLGAYGLYKPYGQFKDYIAIRKLNGYSRTTVISRSVWHAGHSQSTRYRTANQAVAAHWLYKSGESNPSDLQRRTPGCSPCSTSSSRAGDSAGIPRTREVDLFPAPSTCLRRSQKIIALPRADLDFT